MEGKSAKNPTTRLIELFLYPAPLCSQRGFSTFLYSLSQKITQYISWEQDQIFICSTFFSLHLFSKTKPNFKFPLQNPADLQCRGINCKHPSAGDRFWKKWLLKPALEVGD